MKQRISTIRNLSYSDIYSDDVHFKSEFKNKIGKKYVIVRKLNIGDGE
jgi:hypothetical protein